MNEKFLSIYLNDHLAGATAGVELARRTARNNAAAPIGPELDRLAQDIEEDRESLQRLMDELGIRINLLKDAAAWVAEKAGRLKLNGQLVGYSPLSRLVELETLSMGVQGKLSLWQNLTTAAQGEPRLGSADLQQLLERATSQLAVLERLRVGAAQEALG